MHCLSHQSSGNTGKGSVSPAAAITAASSSRSLGQSSAPYTCALCGSTSTRTESSFPSAPLINCWYDISAAGEASSYNPPNRGRVGHQLSTSSASALIGVMHADGERVSAD